MSLKKIKVISCFLLSFSEPLYVIKIDPEEKLVYVGPESKLGAKEFVIKDINWLQSKVLTSGMEVKVKVRSTQPGAFAKINQIGNDKILVKLLSPERAITPGQACVIYDDTMVLGGGWITKEIC